MSCIITAISHHAAQLAWPRCELPQFLNFHCTAPSHMCSGADPNLQDGEGKTVLASAVENQQLEIVEMLLNKGVDIDSQDKKGRNVLLTAAAMGCEDVCLKLMKSGVDMQVIDNDGILCSFLSSDFPKCCLRLLTLAFVNAVEDGVCVHGRVCFTL